MALSTVVMRVAVALVLLGAGWLLGGQLAGVARASLEGTAVDPRVRGGLLRIVRPVVMLVAIVAGLEYLDVDLSTVAAMAGAITLAIGFGLQPAISNLAAGALLLTLRPYREGDHVECANGERGRLLDQGPFSISLERADGVVVHVPNHATFQHAIRNHTRLGRRRVDVDFVLDPDADLHLARTVVLERLRADPGLLADPAPSLQLVALDDRGLRVSVRAWVPPDAHERGGPRLTEDVLAALQLAGIPLAHRPGAPR